MNRIRAARDLVSQLSGWFATLDSRPHEKRLVVGAGLAGALACWFALAWRYPLLVAALPLIAGATVALIRAQSRLRFAGGRWALEAEDDEAGRNLLDRLNLAPPPVPVGRTAAEYELPEFAVDRWEPPPPEDEDENETEPDPEPDEEASEDVADPSAALAVGAEGALEHEVEPEPEVEHDQEESESLLDKLTFSLPPAPVGRTAPAAVPDEELDPEPLSGDRIYEVCETVAGRSVVRHRGLSLFAATDFALDLHLRSHGSDIVVARVRDGVRQTVLNFNRERPPEAVPAGKTLLETFGYPVGRWHGPIS